MTILGLRFASSGLGFGGALVGVEILAVEVLDLVLVVQIGSGLTHRKDSSLSRKS
jgi:hypothetical protein